MSLYLDLLEKCLLGTLTKDPPIDPWSGVVIDAATNKPVPFRSLGPTQTYWLTPGTFDPEKRQLGLDWPATAHTMIGEMRLRQLRAAVLTCLADRVPGDFIECGVWRGGACIMMAAVLAAGREFVSDVQHALSAAGIEPTKRKVYVADSFEGLPKPTHEADQEDQHHTFTKMLAVSEEQVRENFKTYGLLDDNIVFVKGWFNESLRSVPGPLAVLRVDGDMFQSTMDVLEALYDKVSIGGFVIIDDYYAMPTCQRATDIFRHARGITAPLVEIDGVGVYWRRLA